jgi:hypothetical protein
MNTKSELRELDDEELNAVHGGLSCATGVHLTDAKIEARSTTDWTALALSYFGL